MVTTCLSQKWALSILACVLLAAVSLSSGKLTCLGGWKLYYRGGKCVRIFSNLRTWNDARKLCQRQGGDLMQVKDVATSKFLGGLHKTNRINAWIGASKVKKVYTWIDGTSIRLNNWGGRARSKPQECVALMSSSAKWNRLKCTDKVGAVCALDAFHTARSLCPVGWSSYKRKCYRLFRNLAAWNDANKVCNGQKGQLVTIPDKGTSDFLQRTFVSKDRRSNIWIGLNDLKKAKAWMWVNTNLKLGRFQNWTPGQPNYGYGGKQHCVHYWYYKRTNRQWADSKCALKFHFICQKNSYNADINCPYGWDVNIKYKTCVKKYHFKLNWKNARSFCQKLQSDLLTIPDANYNTYTIGRLGTSPSFYWTGLHEVSNTQNKLIWLDTTNQSPKFTSFLNSARVNGKQNCVVFSKTKKWKKVDCDSLNYFMCKRDAYASIACPTGYILDRRTRVCVRLSKDVLEWEKARAVCQKDGGDLIKITSNLMNKFIIGLVTKDKAKYYIGLHDRLKEGNFQWLDSTTKPRFTYWSKGEPNNKNKNQNCVNINGLKDNKWWDGNCFVKRRYICQHAAIVNGRKPVKTKLPLKCPDGWSKYDTGNSCIKYFSDVQTWANARTECGKRGGDLVKIGDQPFNMFVNSVLTKASPKGEPYIGFSDNKKQSKYRWLDETVDSKYNNWHNGEPSNGKEDCAVIVVDPTYNFEWNDVPCSSKKPYICQKPASVTGSDNCGDGWEDSPVSDYCYRFNKEPLSWDDAKGSCSIYGGNLVSVTSPGEMHYLSGRIQALSADKLWTGGNDLANEAGWRWIDRQPFSYFNWDYTPRRNASLNCISIDKTTGRWTVELCLDRHASICKKMGKIISHPTPAPTVKPTNIPKNKVWGCRKGWRGFRGSCYILYTSARGISWKDANSYCMKGGTNLVAIGSYYENAFVYSMLRGQRATTGWIGFNALRTKTSFEWSDGVTRVTYTNWNRGQPNFYTSDEYCSRMAYRARWDDRSCTKATEKKFVCKENKQIRAQSQFQIYKGCNKGGYGFQASCYLFYANLLAFDQAEKYCKTKGGHLATVRDRFDQAFLTAELNRYKADFWIGLSNTKKSSKDNTKFVYSWTSGSNPYFTNWDRSHTGSETNTCVVMESKRPAGLWKNYDCNDKKMFICEYPRVGFTTPKPAVTTPSLQPCPSGWIAINHMCYKGFLDYRKKTNWMDANSQCKSMVSGGTLASVTNPALGARLSTELKKADKLSIYSIVYVWIGLNDRDLEGGYKWVDGQPFVYTAWDTDQPNNLRNRQNCVTWKLGDKWNDDNCYAQYNFVCQAPRGAQVYTTVFPPTIGSTATQCGTGSWRMYNGFCYYYTRQYKKTTWHEAKNQCANRGAHLVSIADQKENNFITALINANKQRNVWIGMSDFDRDVFKWSDGTQPFFYHWLPRQPSKSLFGERCVVLEYDGGWKNVNCKYKYGYLCKKRPGNFSPLPTVIPTPPSGGCPSKFSGVPGTSSCFHIGGVKTEDRKTFTNAALACDKLLAKSRLASIHNDIDEDYITKSIAGLQVPAWIGLQARSRYSKYQWIDSTKNDYAHWAPGYPKYYYKRLSYKSCIDMMIKPRTAGKWSEGSCYDKLPYVCEYRKDPIFPTNKPETGDCLNGYQKYRQSCYRYNSMPQTWSQSEAACSKDGGHLIGVSDRFEEAFVNILMGTQGSPQLWIGLSDTSQRNTFTWSNGWPVLQTFWMQNPDLSKQCVAHSRGQGWNTKDCQINLPSLCEIHNFPLPVPSAVPGKCPSNIWTQYGADCYFVEQKQLKSWPEARYVCQNLGGDLASIHNPTDAQIVFNFLSIDQLDAWIGLQRSGPGSFKWTDGSGVDFYKWAIGSPLMTNDTQYQSCVLAQGFNGNWTDISCFVKHGYVCKVKQIPLVPPTTTTTTGSMKSTRKPPPKKATTARILTRKPVTKNVVTQPPATQPPFQGGVTQKSVQNSKSNSSGIPSGGVAGIVIGIVIVIGVVVLGVYFWRKRGIATPSTTTSGFDNAVYESSREENPIQFSAGESES